MIRVLHHKNFKKEYKKLSEKIKRIFEEKFLLFIENPSNPILKDHALKGRMLGKRSFSITGDIRVIYRFIEKDIVVMFLEIGTHNQVY